MDITQCSCLFFVLCLFFLQLENPLEFSHLVDQVCPSDKADMIADSQAGPQQIYIHIHMIIYKTKNNTSLR